MDSELGLSIYVAGPVDLGSDVKNWKQALREELETLGVRAVLFDPASAYLSANFGANKPAIRRSKYIERVNYVALMNADVMVVSVPAGVQTLGTPIELEFANRGGKPVYALTDLEPGKSVYLDNRLERKDTYSYGEIRSLAESLYAYAVKLETDSYTQLIGDLALEKLETHD